MTFTQIVYCKAYLPIIVFQWSRKQLGAKVHLIGICPFCTLGSLLYDCKYGIVHMYIYMARLLGVRGAKVYQTRIHLLSAVEEREHLWELSDQNELLLHYRVSQCESYQELQGC